MDTVYTSAITALFEQYGFIHPGGAVYSEIRERVRTIGGAEAAGTLPDSAAFLFTAALPYPFSTPGPQPERDCGAIAPFARANYYREAASRLKKIAVTLREKTGCRKQDVRIFCNSPLPEKLLAALLGVGFYGKNNLIITEKAGTACVLAGLILYTPESVVFDAPHVLQPVEYGKRCGSCTACIENCPTGALTSEALSETGSAEGPAPASRFSREKCLQNYATECTLLEEPVMEVWGNRVYGCDSCQQVCPFNRGPFNRTTTGTEKGVLGPYVSLEQFLTLSTAELKQRLKNTALGMSWIDANAIKRNCLIAAAHRKAVGLVPLITTYTDHPSSVLRETARWALQKLGPI